MKKLLLLMSVVLGLGLGNAKAAGVAYLDVRATMAAHPKTEKALKDLESYRRAQYTLRNKELDAEIKKRLGTKKPSELPDAEQKELIRLRNEFEDSFEREVARKDKELTDPILKDIRNVVMALSKEKGFDVVVDAETVFFGGQDITDVVIARLRQ